MLNASTILDIGKLLNIGKIPPKLLVLQRSFQSQAQLFFKEQRLTWKFLGMKCYFH